MSNDLNQDEVDRTFRGIAESQHRRQQRDADQVDNPAAIFHIFIIAVAAYAVVGFVLWLVLR